MNKLPNIPTAPDYSRSNVKSFGWKPALAMGACCFVGMMPFVSTSITVAMCVGFIIILVFNFVQLERSRRRDMAEFGRVRKNQDQAWIDYDKAMDEWARAQIRDEVNAQGIASGFEFSIQESRHRPSEPDTFTVFAADAMAAVLLYAKATHSYYGGLARIRKIKVGFEGTQTTVHVVSTTWPRPNYVAIEETR